MVVLGNGFDVALGIPTRYSQFYKDSKDLRDFATKGNALCQHILDDVNGELWSDLECGLYHYSLAITEEYGEGNQTQAHKLEKEFNELRTALFNYLESVASIPVHVSTSAPALGLMIEWHELDPQFLTFNYSINTANTASLNSRLIFNVDDSINEKIFIYQHGSIFDSKEGVNHQPASIVVGIDDIAQTVEPLHSFLYKSRQRLHDLDNTLSLIESKSFYVVYGCSVGDSDATYFRSIFNKSQRGKTFLIYGYGEKSLSDIVSNIERICEIDLKAFRANNSVFLLDVQDVARTRQKTKDIIQSYLNGLEKEG